MQLFYIIHNILIKIKKEVAALQQTTEIIFLQLFRLNTFQTPQQCTEQKTDVKNSTRLAQHHFSVVSVPVLEWHAS